MLPSNHDRTSQRDELSGTSVAPVTSKLARFRAAKLAALVGVGTLVAGCAENAPQDIFRPAGENADGQDKTMDVKRHWINNDMGGLLQIAGHGKQAKWIAGT